MKDYSKPPLHLQQNRNDVLVQLVGAGNYSILTYASGKQVVYSFTLKDYQGWLPTYVRINRSLLLNPAFISSVQLVERTITLHDGQVLPVARRRIRQIVEQLRLTETANV